MQVNDTAAIVTGGASGLGAATQELLYGDASGEIDIVEFRTVAPDRPTPTAVYVAADTEAARTNWKCFIHRPEDFHTYALVWTSFRLTFY